MCFTNWCFVFNLIIFHVYNYFSKWFSKTTKSCKMYFGFCFFYSFGIFLWNKNAGLKNSWQSKPIFFNFSCKIGSLVIVKQMNQHKSGMKIRQFWEFFLWLFVLHNKKYRKHMMKNCFLFSVFNNVFFY